MTPDDPGRKSSADTRRFGRGAWTPFDVWAGAWAAGALWWATLPAALYGAAVPSRPQRVDGEAATREYARENGLKP